MLNGLMRAVAGAVTGALGVPPDDVLLQASRPATMLFDKRLRAFSFAICNRPELEDGDKIILPPSALAELTALHVQYPMLFQITNTNDACNRQTHCGVMEFSADEGHCYLPHWMMENLLLEEGTIIRLRNVQLPKGKMIKLQPHSKDFLDITNPRVVLERHLGKHSAKTKGDTFMFRFGGKAYYMDVIEAKPADAVCIIETDLAVDFAPPLDYVEPDYKAAAAAVAASGGSSAGSSLAGAGGSSGSAASSGATISSLLGSSGGSIGAGGHIPGLGSIHVPVDTSTSATGAAVGDARRSSFGAVPASASTGSHGTPTVAGSSATPKFVPFLGEGRRLTDSGSPMLRPGASPAIGGLAAPSASSMPPLLLRDSSSSGAASTASSSTAAGTGTPLAAPGTPLVSGGVVLTPGGTVGQQSKPRTMNKFEAARAAKAFAGQGHSLRQ